MRIILGSKSEGRSRVLKRMGVLFTVMSADIDEKAIRLSDPKELTLALARAKADALLPRITEPALLITSDQVVVYEGVIREKPESREQAIEFLESYREHPARCVTSVVVTNTATGARACGTDIAFIYFSWWYPEPVIAEYVDSGDPFLHAGGFDHEHPMVAPWLLKIEGEKDSVTGLPWKLTQELMRQVMS